VTCLLFPFLVSSPWIVLVLALALTGLFAAAAHLKLLKSLHGVGRPSRGAEYYPLAIFLVLLIAGERTWLYVAAVLVLAVADAFAALVGRGYGIVRYQVQSSEKTLEGSLVFFLVAFLAIHLPTLLMTDLPRGVTVLAAVLVALLVTGFEAVSLDGADNLFVPVAVVVVLGKITRKPFPEIVFQNLSLLAIGLLIAFLVRRMPFFNVGATVTLILYAYGAWSLGSWLWALPVFAGLVVYLLAWLEVAIRQTKPAIRVRAVAQALLGPLLVMALANGTRAFADFYAPYLGASAAVLALALTEPLYRLELARRRPWTVGAAAATALGCAFAVLPSWLVTRAPAGAPALIAVLVLGTTALNLRLELRQGETPVKGWTAARFLLPLAVAGCVLVAQHLGVTARWNPG